MASDSENTRMVNSAVLGALLVLFVALKLCHVIEWSWWWVTAPIWGPIVFGISVILIAFACVWAYDLIWGR